MVRRLGPEADVYYEVRRDGSLRSVPAAPPLPDGAWEQCCVVECLVGSGRARQPCLFLHGAWSDVLVDPTAWGFGSTTLADFTVREATQRRVRLHAAHESPGFYTLRGGCRPALWPLPAGVPGPSTATTGLQALELRWAASHDAALQAPSDRRRRAEEWAVDLLPCQQPGKRQRLGVYERVERRAELEAERWQQGGPQREAAGPPPVVPSANMLLQDDTVDAAAPLGASEEELAEARAAKAAWARLKRAGPPREQYSLAVRIMHGSLYVNSFLCHIHVLPADAAYCEGAACQPVGVLEGLSHAFVGCPAVAPAAVRCMLLCRAAQRPRCARGCCLGMSMLSGSLSPICSIAGPICECRSCTACGCCGPAARALAAPSAPLPCAQPRWRRCGRPSSVTSCGRQWTCGGCLTPTPSGSGAAMSASRQMSFSGCERLPSHMYCCCMLGSSPAVLACYAGNPLIYRRLACFTLLRHDRL